MCIRCKMNRMQDLTGHWTNIHASVFRKGVSLFREANAYINEELNATQRSLENAHPYIHSVFFPSCRIYPIVAGLLEITCHWRLAILMFHPIGRSNIICSQCPLAIHGISPCGPLPILIILLHLHLSRLWPGGKLPTPLGLRGREQIDEE